MEDLLVIILQACGEIFFQFFCAGALDWLILFWDDDSRRTNVPGAFAISLIVIMGAVGALIGWLSLFFVPHTLLPWPWLRIANLIIAPWISAYVSWRIATWRRTRDAIASPGTHALIAGAACAGLVAVRFVGGLR